MDRIASSTLSPASAAGPCSHHFTDDGALRLLETEAAGKILVDILDLDTQPAAAHRAALLELLDDALDGFGRHREGDTDVAAGRAVDRRVDADDVALEVEGRAAGVAVVHGSVDLHVVVRAADVTGERRDDTSRDRAAEAERIADRQHPIADARGLLRELQNRQRLLRLDLQECKIGARVGADDLGVNLLLVIEAHLHLGGAVDDVVVGDDVAVSRNDEAGAGRLTRPLLHRVALAIRHVFEELVQRVIVGETRDALERTSARTSAGSTRGTRTAVATAIGDLDLVRRRDGNDSRLHAIDYIGERQRLGRGAWLELGHGRRRILGEPDTYQAGSDDRYGGQAPQIAADRFGWPALCYDLGRAGLGWHAHEPPFCEAGNLFITRPSEAGITAAFRLP